MGASNKQNLGQDQGMDIQIFEFCKVPCAYKGCPAGHTHFYDVMSSCSYKSYATDHEHSKRFSLGKRGREKEMGIGSLGQDLQT